MIATVPKDKPKPTRDGLASTQIPLDVDAALAAYCQRTGREKRPTIAKVLKWFMAWDYDAVRTAIIGGTDEGMETTYADVLTEVARQLRMKAAGIKEGPAPQADLSSRSQAPGPAGGAAAEGDTGQRPLESTPDAPTEPRKS